jgi:hypothetical protein
MIQYIIAAGIGAFLGSRSKKSKKSYAHGGEVGKTYEIKGVDVTYYEDSYEEGELDQFHSYYLGQSDFPYKTEFSSKKDLFDTLNEFISYGDFSESDFFVDEDTIQTSALVKFEKDSDWDEFSAPTEKEKELWRKGKMKLYSAHFVFPYEVYKKEKIDFAKGGKLIGFTNDPIYTKNDISVQRIGGSTMWNVAYKGETKGRVLDAFTKEQAVRKFEKTKDDYAKGGKITIDKEKYEYLKEVNKNCNEALNSIAKKQGSYAKGGKIGKYEIYDLRDELIDLGDKDFVEYQEEYSSKPANELYYTFLDRLNDYHGKSYAKGGEIKLGKFLKSGNFDVTLPNGKKYEIEVDKKTTKPKYAIEHGDDHRLSWRRSELMPYLDDIYIYALSKGEGKKRKKRKYYSDKQMKDLLIKRGADKKDYKSIFGRSNYNFEQDWEQVAVEEGFDVDVRNYKWFKKNRNFAKGGSVIGDNIDNAFLNASKKSELFLDVNYVNGKSKTIPIKTKTLKGIEQQAEDLFDLDNVDNIQLVRFWGDSKKVDIAVDLMAKGGKTRKIRKKRKK